MSGWQRFVTAIICTCLLGAVAACSDSAGKPLRIAINPWPGYAHLFVAADKGFFADEGVNVELVEFTSLADVRRAFERGQVDGMASTLAEVLEVSRGGGERAIICIITDYSNGADVVLADRRYGSMPALKGARIGLEPGTVDRLMLYRALAVNGMKTGDVIPVAMPQKEMSGAIASGDVQAVISYPPTSVAIQSDNSVSVVFSSAEIPGEISDAVSFRETVTKSRQRDLAAFTRAWDRAVDFSQQQPAEALKLMSNHTGMSVEELAAAFEGIEVVSGDEQISLLRRDGPIAEGLKSLSEVLWPSEPAYDLAGADLIAPDLLVQADPDHGRW